MNPSTYSSNAVFQLSLSSKELFHSNFLYWLATDNTLNPHPKGPNMSQNFFNQLLHQFGSSLANTFNLDDYAVFREYEHFDFCIWEKKKNTNSGDRAQNENLEKECLEDNEEELNENATEKVSYAGTCDTKELEKVVLVLENKFKSIPYQEQLDFYAGKVLRVNHPKTFNCISNKLYKTKKSSQQAIIEICQEYKKGCNNKCTKTCKHHINSLGCEFYLLTLAQIFPAHNNIQSGGLWTIVNYTNYSNYLNNAKSTVGLKGFACDLINNYYNFIHNFSGDVNTDISGITPTTNSIDVFKGRLFAPYHSIRMHDIWQKLVMSKLVFDVENAFTNANTGKKIILFSEDEKIFGSNKKNKHISALPARHNIYIGTGYGTSGAILEIKYKIDRDHAFIVQIQNNCYRRGILYDKSQGFTNSAYKAISGLHLPSVNPLPGTGTLNNFFVTGTPPQTPIINYRFNYPTGGNGSGTFTGKGQYKFNTYGANTDARIYFPYQYVSLDNAIIRDIVSAIVHDICDVIRMYP